MKRLRQAFLAPSVLLLATLFFVPLVIIAVYSFESRGAYGGVTMPWSLDSYARIFDPLYLKILWRSFWVAGVSTAICLILGFPLALFISRAGKHRGIYLQMVMLPFWTSFLIRTYAWMFLLRDTGLINTALMATGLISEPLPLLYNDFAVVLGLVYGFVPFMVLPLYTNLEKLDPALLEAAADLGAPPMTALMRITLPLCRPGITAGSILVFIPCLGAYLTPDLMGGGKSIMIGTLVQNQFTTARDWPFGAALSLVLMALTLGLLYFVSKRAGGEDLL
jgi:spermidine/putrescine transport system permease protein